MERQKTILAWLLAAVCLVWFAGCGWGSAPADNSVDGDLADSVDDGPAAGPETAAQPVAQATGERRLKAGDRFPLLKTVANTLQQPSPDGWITSRSTLEMLMSVTVEEIHPTDGQPQGPDPRFGQKRLQVSYQRVRFSEELPGQPRVDYDSIAPASPIPRSALGFHALNDNSFGFWLSADNQPVELAAFDQFINRCLNAVPPERRQQAAAAMTLPPAEAVASFIDDSVGVLPASAAREGDSWVRDRQVVQPVPLHVSNRYTLRRTTRELAEIEILGTISPPVPHGSIAPSTGDVRVVVRGGRSQGACLVDRRTGLPVESRAEQTLEMTVRMPDGSEFDQHKSTLTTIRSVAEAATFPGGAAGATPAAGAPPRLAQGAADAGK
jgi:hypothetical protein